MQRVETQYTTAVTVQKPRSLTTVVKNVLEEARLAKSAFYYKWSVRGSSRPIQGGSIDLARSIARNFGNVAVDIHEEPETVTHFRFKAVFIDLESGLNWPRLFRQRKGQDTGMKDKERAEDIIYQIGQSKAQRNAVFQGVPGWLVDKAIEIAEESEIKGIKDEGIEIARVKVIGFFTQYGADQDRIEAKLGKPVEKWTEKDIADLRASATAIKEGRTSVNEIFPQVDEKKEPPIKAEKKKDEKTEKKEKKRGRPKGPAKKKEALSAAEISKVVLGDDAETLEKTEGDDKGETEKVASEGNDKALSGDAVEDLLNSEIWLELQEIKNKYPSSYLRVTRGQTPKTNSEVRTVIDEIMLMVNQDQQGPPPGD